MSDGSIIVNASTGEFFPNITQANHFETFLRAVVYYRGPFSSGHETGALWWVHNARHELVIRGGDEYNYIK